MKKYYKFIILFSCSIFLISNSFAQCKGFTKKHCLPALDPYTSNGQLNSANLVPGQDAEIQLNFNKGLSYRLMVCTDPYFENTTFQIKDQADTQLFNDTLTSTYGIKDIEVNRTQPLTLSIQVPPQKNTTGIVRNGCVTILVGFKD